jgi:two-component system, NtrC family, response regulator
MNDNQVLLIEDEKKIRELLSRILEIEGYKVFSSEDGKGGLEILTKYDIKVVITDVKLPDINGIELLEKIKGFNSSIEVIVLTAYGNITDAVKAIKSGAFDYLRKGEDDDKIIFVLSRAFEKIRLKKQIKNLEAKIEVKNSFDKIIGNSNKILSSIELAKKVAPTDTTVMLLGETGVGKELFAEAIHEASKRRDKKFIAINCAAIPEDLQESEFFGHKKGSFTGANYDKKGVFEEADGGTLFLDEIGEMNIELQAKLLRAIETGSFNRIGENAGVSVNIRIITATNRVLSEEVSSGRFRKDLYYRLNTFSIVIPSLRERKDDIEVFIKYFIELSNQKINKRIENYDRGFLDKLLSYSFPGNTRELKNIIERSVILSENNLLTENLLPSEILSYQPVVLEKNFDPNNGYFDSEESIESIEKSHIIKTLSKVNNNKIEAAKILKIGLTTLYRKLKEYGIE